MLIDAHRYMYNEMTVVHLSESRHALLLRQIGTQDCVWCEHFELLSYHVLCWCWLTQAMRRQGLARAVAHIHDGFLKDFASKQRSPTESNKHADKQTDASARSGPSTRGKRTSGAGSSATGTRHLDSEMDNHVIDQTANELAALAADFDPLHQSCWHPLFAVDGLTLPELLAAARQVADDKAAAELNSAAEISRQDSEGKKVSSNQPAFLEWHSRKLGMLTMLDTVTWSE